MTKDPIFGSLERLLTPSEMATLLGVSLSWLAKARLRGDGPLYIKSDERYVTGSPGSEIT